MAKYKKIIIVFAYNIKNFPPVISLLNILNDLGYSVTIISRLNGYEKLEENKNITYINISELQKSNTILSNIYKCTIGKYLFKKRIWRHIDQEYNENSIIWVISDATMLLLGKRIFKYNYFFQVLELSEKWRVFSKIKWLSINPKKYFKKAKKIIDVEYNRAHILKSWFELNETPYIIPNKPYIKNELKKYSKINSNEYSNKLMSELKGKKIILYQGIVNKERPLNEFINAVEKLGKDYAFVLMSSKNDEYKNITSANFYYIPFISPPLHLEITSHAYIGILSYIPNKSNGYSPLNSLYCAPNKIFEYSMFGIPMIGNDIPGLSVPFNKFNCGICINKYDESEIIKVIQKIENSYTQMSSGARKYYDYYDIKQIVKDILS